MYNISNNENAALNNYIHKMTSLKQKRKLNQCMKL